MFISENKDQSNNVAANNSAFKTTGSGLTQSFIKQTSQNFMDESKIEIKKYVNLYTLKFKCKKLEHEYLQNQNLKNSFQFACTLSLIIILSMLHNIFMGTFFIQYTFYYCFLFLITLIQWKIITAKPYMLCILQLTSSAAFIYFYSQNQNLIKVQLQNLSLATLSDQMSTEILLGFIEAILILSIQTDFFALEAARISLNFITQFFINKITAYFIFLELIMYSYILFIRYKYYYNSLVEFIKYKVIYQQKCFLLAITSQNSLIITSIQNNSLIFEECNTEAAIKNKINDLKDFDNFIQSLRVGKAIQEKQKALNFNKGIQIPQTLKEYLTHDFFLKQKIFQEASQQNALSSQNKYNSKTVYAKRINDGLEDSSVFKVQVYFMITDKPYIAISILEDFQQTQLQKYEVNNNGSQLINRSKQTNFLIQNLYNSSNNQKLTYTHYINYQIHKLDDLINKLVKSHLENNDMIHNDFNNQYILQKLAEHNNQLLSILIFSSQNSTIQNLKKTTQFNLMDYLKNIFFCMKSFLVVLNSMSQIEDHFVNSDPSLLKYLLYSLVLNIHSNMQYQEYESKLNYSQKTAQTQLRITISYLTNEEGSKIKIGSPIKLTGKQLFGNLNNVNQFNFIEKNVIQIVAQVIQGKREILIDQYEERNRLSHNQHSYQSSSEVGLTVYIIDIPKDINQVNKEQCSQQKKQENFCFELLKIENHLNKTNKNLKSSFNNLKGQRSSKKYIQNLVNCFQSNNETTNQDKFSVPNQSSLLSVSKNQLDNLSYSQSQESHTQNRTSNPKNAKNRDQSYDSIKIKNPYKVLQNVEQKLFEHPLLNDS
ncbi:hypothetical protein ABPG72_012961 [Tetrahymena utriculariae]